MCQRVIWRIKMKCSWSRNYERGIKSVSKGEIKKAYNYGIECLRIVKKDFREGSLEEQIFSLDKYLKSIFLLDFLPVILNFVIAGLLYLPIFPIPLALPRLLALSLLP